ncbi:MAG: hypothetical protein Q8N26_26660 [Myxococcales bacterium]|nr:hypothetical protein [Myxococcales bacterium]
MVIPFGCVELQSGAWHHATDSRFQYEAVDDGGSLELSVFFTPAVDAGRPVRRFSRDGGLAWLVPAPDAGVDGGELMSDAGPAPIAELALRRTPTGFVGVARAAADAGACPFPARIIACEPGALVLETIARQPRECAVVSDAGWQLQRLLKTGFDAGPGPSDTMRHDLPQDGGQGASNDGGSAATPPPAP